MLHRDLKKSSTEPGVGRQPENLSQALEWFQAGQMLDVPMPDYPYEPMALNLIQAGVGHYLKWCPDDARVALEGIKVYGSELAIVQGWLNNVGKEVQHRQTLKFYFGQFCVWAFGGYRESRKMQLAGMKGASIVEKLQAMRDSEHQDGMRGYLQSPELLNRFGEPKGRVEVVAHVTGHSSLQNDSGILGRIPDNPHLASARIDYLESEQSNGSQYPRRLLSVNLGGEYVNQAMRRLPWEIRLPNVPTCQIYSHTAGALDANQLVDAVAQDLDRAKYL